jgi:hypothetical protein
LPEAYDSLPAPFRAYVDALLEHAQSALWPERRAALESLYRGVARSSPAALRAAAVALGLGTEAEAATAEAATAELIFSWVLTAYLARLGEAEVTNPDQAEIYRLSLDPDHVALAERWRQARAEPPGDA